MVRVNTSITLDKIVKGVPINNNQEVDYTAAITVHCDKDVTFEYAIVDDNYGDANAIFNQARKYITLRHVNSDGIYRKKVLLLKSLDTVTADVSIDLDLMYSANNVNYETLGPRAQVMLSGAENGATETGKPWYENTTTLVIVVILVILFLYIVSSSGMKRRVKSLFD